MTSKGIAEPYSARVSSWFCERTVPSRSRPAKRPFDREYVRNSALSFQSVPAWAFRPTGPAEAAASAPSLNLFLSMSCRPFWFMAMRTRSVDWPPICQPKLPPASCTKTGALHPAQDVTVRRSLPRLWHPADPIVLLQGARRSFKHGADGRMNAEGELVCRLTGSTVTGLTVRVSGQPDVTLGGPDLLTRGVENGAVPPECDALLSETVLLDPGSAPAAAVAGQTAAPTSRLDSVLVEQTVWWALRDPAIDPAPIVSRSGYTGHLPSPLAITPPQRPWVPLHLDWDVEVDPGTVADWTLD